MACNEVFDGEDGFEETCGSNGKLCPPCELVELRADNERLRRELDELRIQRDGEWQRRKAAIARAEAAEAENERLRRELEEARESAARADEEARLANDAFDGQRMIVQRAESDMKAAQRERDAERERAERAEVIALEAFDELKRSVVFPSSTGTRRGDLYARLERLRKARAAARKGESDAE